MSIEKLKENNPLLVRDYNSVKILRELFLTVKDRYECAIIGLSITLKSRLLDEIYLLAETFYQIEKFVPSAIKLNIILSDGVVLKETTDNYLYKEDGFQIDFKNIRKFDFEDIYLIYEAMYKDVVLEQWYAKKK